MADAPTRWQVAYQKYTTLSVPEKGRVIKVLQEPFEALCARTSQFLPPFEYLRDRLDLLDPSLRETVILARRGEAIAQRWLDRFFFNVLGPRGTEVPRLTHEESMWLYHATQEIGPKPQLDSISANSRWSPTSVARDEFVKKRALTLFYKVEKMGVFTFGRPFMFSSGDISTKNEEDFRARLAVQLDETLVLYPHVVQAIDTGVLNAIEFIDSEFPSQLKS